MRRRNMSTRLPSSVHADGEVVDCDGTGECWPISWIEMDSHSEDQQYGADLTCYDNDGGDCGGLLASNPDRNVYSNSIEGMIM